MIARIEAGLEAASVETFDGAGALRPARVSWMPTMSHIHETLW